MDIMVRTPLYTFDGKFVANVPIMPFLKPVEVIVWGIRMFIRREDGKYREADGMTAAIEGMTPVNVVDELGAIPTDIPTEEKPEESDEGEQPAAPGQ
jgi:hypothetical protein